MRALIILGTLLLAGCSSTGLTPNTLQFSKETLPFPQSYQTDAARVVSQRRGDPALVQISVPQTTLGQNAWSPQRWYVCLRGLTPPPEKPGLPTMSELLSRNPRIYDLVLVFGAEGARPTVRGSYDAALCQNVRWEPLTAEAPPA